MWKSKQGNQAQNKMILVLALVQVVWALRAPPRQDWQLEKFHQLTHTSEALSWVWSFCYSGSLNNPEAS